MFVRPRAVFQNNLDTALLVLVGEVADVVQSQQTRGCVQGEVIAGV